ncbi:MAG: hypothetical protein GXY03_10630 [Solirubrobacterales bacterium]|nr:hypothetical protein [Solirubrobacterales bacterium]
MRDRPKGAVARATAVAEGVAGAVRRRQRERAPRILLYRAAGDPRLWPPGARGHDELLEVAERMTAAAKPANSGN